MAKLELTPTQNEQLVSMSRDKNIKPKEIKKFFIAKYDIKIPTWKIGNTRNAAPKDTKP